MWACDLQNVGQLSASVPCKDGGAHHVRGIFLSAEARGVPQNAERGFPMSHTQYLSFEGDGSRGRWCCTTGVTYSHHHPPWPEEAHSPLWERRDGVSSRIYGSKTDVWVRRGLWTGS